VWARVRSVLFFIFPVGTSEPIFRRPRVTYALAALNVLVFIALNIGVRMSQGSGALNEAIVSWGYIPAEREPLTLVTHLFLHAGFLHLLGNVWFLLLFGRVVEDRLGSKLFALLYLLAGLGSAALQDVFTVGTLRDVAGAGWTDQLARMGGRVGREMPMIGASGAIFGIMGALLVVALWAEFRFLWFHWFVLFVLWESLLRPLAEILSTQSRGYSIGGVAIFGHLGGFATGFLVALLLKQLLFRRLPPDPTDPGSIQDVGRQRGFSMHAGRTSGRISPEQRAVEHLLRLIHKGRTHLVSEQYLEYLVQFPGLTLPPPQMLLVAEALAETHSDRRALEAFERVLGTAEVGPVRRHALLGLARMCCREKTLHRRGQEHLRELLTQNLDAATRREAELLLMRVSEEGQTDAQTTGPSRLTQESGETPPPSPEFSDRPIRQTGRPAYVPEPSAPTPDDSEQRRIPVTREVSRSLPPPRPVHVPDEGESRDAAAAGHAVILTGRQRIDVPRVARIVARGTGRSMVDVSGQIAQGMGVVLETDSLITAHRVASLLNGNRLSAAVVDLSQIPDTWEEHRLLSAALRGDQLHVAHEAQGQETIPVRDLIVVAHAEVPLRPVDPAPEIVCDLLALSPARHLRAVQGEFQHASPGHPETLVSFVGLVGQRAWRAKRDAGLMQSLTSHRGVSLRFASLAEYEAYVRWLTLCAFAPAS
jgi:membrane associated rhomboid family serine protease